MATGFDKLIDFLLSEIALCGVQGAGSADFHSFIQKFYEHTQTDDSPQSGNKTGSRPPPETLGRTFYERVWHWVSNHSDIRITYQNEVRHYSLSEFEAAELQDKGATEGTSTNSTGQSTVAPAERRVTHSKALAAIHEALRERILKEGQASKNPTALASQVSASTPPHRSPRIVPEGNSTSAPIFDDPESTITAPRLYASQNRVWQALTGHGIDLKKVPSMEFVLLSLIAARGANGVTQPDLTQLSGQDKRSVPHRTNELARKGYILKHPVQAGKIRTSLCVHTKFVSQSHFLSSGAVEDVFQEGTFVLSGFVHLLYSKLKDAGIVPTRDIRTKLGVPMRTWNKRATQGALIRLDQTGMIKRFRVRKKKSEDSWATCIQVLREPRDEDVSNLGFRRQPTAIDETVDELLDEDVDGDTLMRDLEVDMLDDADVGADAHAHAQHNIDDSGRIPPQWTPDRFLANIVFDVVALGGRNGWDAGMLRDRIVGPFWRRPMESYFTRLTDDWEKTQPLSLRHLAIIRDSRNTQEKKFIHYVYRTYKNFQKAVEAGVVHWAGVSQPAVKEPTGEARGRPKKQATNDVILDAWGFQTVKAKDLIHGDGSATLSEVRLSIVHPRKYGPRWDTALTQEIGYQKSRTPIPKIKVPRGKGKFMSQVQDNGDEPTTRVRKLSKPKKISNLSLTPEERTLLGLKQNGRLSKSVEKQILAHRQKTGDPTSLPDKIEDEPPQRGRAPLMTAEERIAAGLPAKGRLGIARENEIREERGLDKLSKKPKKREKKPFKEPALLSKEQRIALGWKGHGRLPQDLIESLRREREDGIALEDSKVIPKYMDIMRAKAGTPAASAPVESIEDQATPVQAQQPLMDQDSQDNSVQPSRTDVEARTSSPLLVPEKRKANSVVSSSETPKRRRVESNASLKKSVATMSPQASLSPDNTTSTAMIITDSGSRAPAVAVDHETEAIATTQVAEDTQEIVQSMPTPARNVVALSVESQQSPASTTKARAKAHLPAPPPRLVLLPDSSDLDTRTQAIIDRYMNRSSPGLYINPLAKHKVARGRPRKAFIATFKLPHLKEYDWFTSDTGQTQATPQNTSTKVSETPRKSDAQQDGHNTSAHSATIADVSSPSPMIAPSPNETCAQQLRVAQQDDSHGDRQLSVAPDASLDKPVMQPVIDNDTVEEQAQSTPRTVTSPESRALSNAVSDNTETDQEQYESDIEKRKQLTDNVSVSTDTNKQAQQDSSFMHQQPTSETDAESGVPQKRYVPDALPIPPTAAGWSAINTSARPSLSRYESPYAPSVQSESTPPPPPTVNVTSRDASVAPAAILQAPVVDGDDNTSLLQGGFSAISEIQAPPLPKPKPRSKASTTGSPMHFRREVILDIIDLCHGVFPDQGEIGRPFSTLWDQRHGHKRNMKKPIASTVNETLRNMCFNPDFDLKRMVFLVKHRNGPFTSEKAMITKSHMTPRSPEVLRLAYNVANFAHDKSHQYFPEEIRHLIDEKSLYYPVTIAPKDESIVLSQLSPELEQQIKEAKRRQRNELARQKRLEAKARMAQNAQVEQAPSKQGLETDGAPRAKRTRLASLNDKNKRYRRAPVQKANVDLINENSDEEHETEEPDAAETNPIEHTSLVWTRPWVAPAVDRGTAEDEDSSSETDESDDESSGSPPVGMQKDSAMDNERSSTTLPAEKFDHPTATVIQKGRKRVRIADPSGRSVKKKARLSTTNTVPTQDVEYTGNASTESDVHSSSEADEELQDGKDVQPKKMAKKRRTYMGRQRGKPGPPPTLLERLTGLTGDPNAPVYKPPPQKQRVSSQPRPWRVRKRSQLNKQKKDRKYVEFLDPADKFKKLSCTLVIAASMSGEDGLVDWSVVEKVYSSDKLFDLTRTKKLWTWMQTSMAVELAELTTTFQTLFLEAYEIGQVATIEDPNTYDWVSLVQWTMRKCAYPELPLPTLREALRQFVVDESSYEALDRARWYREKIADRSRTLLQLQHSFVAPIHRSREPTWSAEDKLLKAQSWIRANTATPQTLYDGKQAHDRLMTLGETVLTSVVGDYVEKRNLRMRKLKRLLPGRNYSFTKAFAKKYVRPFELGDFMAAIRIKKDMDAAFLDDDPQKRVYNISRSEEDGSVMAILNLVSEGRVKLVPQIPSVNNEFGAPLPRLSVWGFCEGDYIHRAIDRNRLFWDIYVVPTAKYQFSNPLQPLQLPLVPTDTGESTGWSSLPEPPLPGKHNPDALLPIWSSIDGQSITWPWWYRILNLVLQPLVFQPGATSTDISLHCPEHTTELFEIELVLGWLESVQAVSKTSGGGYVTLPGFWAAFGDKLHGTEDDWFGEHVKRKSKNHEKQQWREQYNLRHSTLQTQDAQQADAEFAESDVGEEHVQESGGTRQPSPSQQILKNPKRQYRIMQQALNSQKPQGEEERGSESTAVRSPGAVRERAEEGPTAESSRTSVSQTPDVANTPGQDVEMLDADGEDVDAEGEVDDSLY